MSYILEALKKSDQQRQRGATPTLAMAPTMLLETRSSAPVLFGLATAALVATGVTIGLLHPWQPSRMETRSSAPERVLAPPTHPAQAKPSSAAPPPAEATRPPPSSPVEPRQPPVATRVAAQKVPPQPRPSAPTKDAALATPVAPSEPAKAAENPPPVAVAESGSKAISELPPAVRKQIPPLAISAYIYSPDPQGRMVGINDRLLREGDILGPGIRLEEIRPSGMVFSFKGYRFRHDPQ